MCVDSKGYCQGSHQERTLKTYTIKDRTMLCYVLYYAVISLTFMNCILLEDSDDGINNQNWIETEFDYFEGYNVADMCNCRLVCECYLYQYFIHFVSALHLFFFFNANMLICVFEGFYQNYIE